MYTCECMCTYTYTYIYIYIYVCINIYIHICVYVRRGQDHFPERGNLPGTLVQLRPMQSFIMFNHGCPICWGCIFMCCKLVLRGKPSGGFPNRSMYHTLVLHGPGLTSSPHQVVVNSVVIPANAQSFRKVALRIPLNIGNCRCLMKLPVDPDAQLQEDHGGYGATELGSIPSE